MTSDVVSAEWATAWSVVDRDGRVVHSTGPRDVRVPWTSVSKLTVALLVGYDVAAGRCAATDSLGPEGSTIAHLLSHASGLGPDASALRSGVGRKRIYTSFGYELLVAFLGGVENVVGRAKNELGLTSVVSDGSLAGGLMGTLEDVEEVARRWLGGDPVLSGYLPTMTAPFLPELDGVVPGFGRFDPCPWGLGPQIRGTGDHWMGAQWPATSFGHFGQSGTMVLADPEHHRALVAVSDRGFGSWAVATWPTWTSACHKEFIA